MALIKCDECGVDVSDKAAACPKCGNPIHAAASGFPAAPVGGYPVPPPSKTQSSAGRRLGSGLAIFILAVIAFMVYEAQSPSKPTADTSGNASAAAPAATSPPDASSTEQTATAQAPAPAAPPVIEISAPQLYEEYKANEVLADTKYKGQWLYVSGLVSEIGKDFTDDPYVNLLGENEYATVRAMFSKSAIQKLATLHKGQQISVMCRGKGKLIGDPILDCTSDDVPPRPQHAQASTTTTPAESAPAEASTQASETPAPPATATAPPAYATSFDCTKAHSTSEMLICGDADLAALDVELSKLYAQAKAAAPDKRAFAEATRQNWNWRQQNCSDKACLVNWYADQKQRFVGIVDGQQSASQAPQTSQRAASYPTSFDCSASTFLDEKAICGDPGLAAMDVEMANEYAAAMKRTTNRAKLDADQSDWHAVRRDCASDLNCLRHAYGVRIDQLRQS